VTSNTAAVSAHLTGATYSFKFAVEHTGSWSEATLAAALSAITFESETTQSGAAADLTTTTTYTDAFVASDSAGTLPSGVTGTINTVVTFATQI
jgi:hypothetical protein